MSAADDDLGRLRDALRGATPAADPAARAETVARAMLKFDHLQASGDGVRSRGVRRFSAGILKGVHRMFAHLTSPAALGATASFAAIAVGAVLIWPAGESQNPPQRISEPMVEATSDSAAPKAAAEAPSTFQRVESAPLAAARAPEIGIAPMPASPAIQPAPQGDRFSPFDPNPVKLVAEAPVSTFSVDVDTASWSWIRASLRMGTLPDPASVRIEEMVNYFPYSYPAPVGDDPFSVSVSAFAAPWNSGTHLVRIGLQGQVPTDRPPLALVFLIDTSGSMQGQDRLGLLKASFGMFLDTLRPEDQVSIIAYAGSAGEVLAPTPAADRRAILDALARLEAGGSTAGGEGLSLAYRVAERMGGPGTLRRVVLATDGDFNVGPSDTAALKRLVEAERKSGTYLSVLGFGRGNLNDALMQTLAQNGNGQAAYIDSAEEARKVLVDQGGGALFPIARDVKVQVEWNPATVAEYRLIGYETRGLAREDFNDDMVDAGEIGAGHQVTALYEITPVSSAARLIDPLRYQTAPPSGQAGEFGWLRLRYKTPDDGTSRLVEAPILAQMADAGPEEDWAAAIAGFGQLLTGGQRLGNWGWDDLLKLAEGAKAEDRFGYRSEALSLVRTARTLSGQ